MIICVMKKIACVIHKSGTEVWNLGTKKYVRRTQMATKIAAKTLIKMYDDKLAPDLSYHLLFSSSFH
jgi:hypothetical protein